MDYIIVDEFLENVVKKANRIVKKCAALGQPFTLSVGEPTYVSHVRDGGLEVRYPAHVVSVEGVARIDGWRFVARIEHTEAGNLVMNAPGMKCPERYREAKPHCDHCHAERFRKETFVIVSDDGEYRQVGRDCLALYTRGLDAEACVLYSEMACMMEGQSGNCGGCAEWGYDPKVFVAACLANIEVGGYDRDKIDWWVEESIYEPKNATRPSASDYLAANREKVEAVIESARNSEDASDYMANVRVVFRMEAISIRRVRLVASYCAKYLKETAKAKAVAKKASESSHVGKVGERVRFRVRVNDGKAYRVLFRKSVHIAWNTYAETAVVELIDVDGNVYKWNASNLDAFDEASEGATEIEVVGTVKEHSEYKGVKQTVITRCRPAA